MNIEELLALAQHEKQKFGRSIDTQIYRTKKGILTICRMHDYYHDMELCMLIDEKELILKEIEGRMVRIPYPTCQLALKTLSRVKGERLMQKGILRLLKKKIGKEEGCTHFFEMIESTLRALFTEFFDDRWKEYSKRLSQEERHQMGIRHPLLRNTCITFNERFEDEKIFNSGYSKIKDLIEKEKKGTGDSNLTENN